MLLFVFDEEAMEGELVWGEEGGNRERTAFGGDDILR